MLPTNTSIESTRLVSDVDDIGAEIDQENLDREPGLGIPMNEHATKLPATEYASIRQYNWRWLCMPRLPFSAPSKPPPFFSINEKIPWYVAVVMGFQHAIAMLGGVITPPLLISGPFNARLTSSESQYLLAVSLIMSGFLSIVQVYQLRLGHGYVLGTGLISVVGTSFTFLPIAQSSVAFMMQVCADRPSSPVPKHPPAAGDLGQSALLLLATLN
jgi:hypothetical protein